MIQEHRQPVTPVRITATCGDNGCTGQLKYNGRATDEPIPLVGHKCLECGHTHEVRGKRYSTIEHEVAA